MQTKSELQTELLLSQLKSWAKSYPTIRDISRVIEALSVETSEMDYLGYFDQQVPVERRGGRVDIVWREVPAHDYITEKLYSLFDKIDADYQEPHDEV